jgi:hypothetical protein
MEERYRQMPDYLTVAYALPFQHVDRDDRFPQAYD